jgi:hypothetical protein
MLNKQEPTNTDSTYIKSGFSQAFRNYDYTTKRSGTVAAQSCSNYVKDRIIGDLGFDSRLGQRISSFFLRFASCCVYTLTMIKLFTVNAPIVLFYFISLHRALHVSTTSGHPQMLQIFVYNYQTATFTFTFVYAWFFNRSHFDNGLLKSCVIWQLTNYIKFDQ